VKSESTSLTNLSYGLKADRPNHNQRSKPNWLDDVNKKKEDVSLNLGSGNAKDNSSANMLKNQLIETEGLLAIEQKKVIELTRKLEQMMQNSYTVDKNFKMLEKKMDLVWILLFLKHSKSHLMSSIYVRKFLKVDSV